MCKDEQQLNISVIIPAYNLEGYISKAIDSVLAQSSLPFEILVIDDGSTDKTAEIIKSYGDKVKYIFQENKGHSGARNKGIAEATGKWITFLDGDDQWLPTYIASFTTILSNNQHLKWATGNYYNFLYSENRKAPPISSEKALLLLDGKDYISNYLIATRQNMQGFSGNKIIHRDVFEKVGHFDTSILLGEDTDLWWRINYHFPNIGYCPKPLAIYTLDRSGSMTETFNEKKYTEKIRLLDKHLALSHKHGMLSQFEPIISITVQRFIRGLLFQNNPKYVYIYLNKYKKQIPTSFTILIRVLMISPSLTAFCCHKLSLISRRFNLRKIVNRKPLT